MRRLTYHITNHGYGHAVRSCDIIQALGRLAPDVGVTIATTVPRGVFKNRLRHPQLSFRAASFDTGMVQLDSIRVDVAQTLQQASDALGRYATDLAGEKAQLRAERADLVVADIPGLPLRAAAELGLPAIGVGNFSWDWIYAPFATDDSRWCPIIENYRHDYGLADLLLRLPFAGDMSAFEQAEDVSLLASPAASCRDALARTYGLDPGKQWALLSFAELHWTKEALDNIRQSRDTEFLTVAPLAFPVPTCTEIDRQAFPFAGVLASSDVVISKPGYGILSDCIANEKPLIYTDREHFQETPVLEAAIKRYLRHVRIPSADLYAGRLAPALACVPGLPSPSESLPLDGQVMAAQRLLRMRP